MNVNSIASCSIFLLMLHQKYKWNVSEGTSLDSCNLSLNWNSTFFDYFMLQQVVVVCVITKSDETFFNVIQSCFTHRFVAQQGHPALCVAFHTHKTLDFTELQTNIYNGKTLNLLHTKLAIQGRLWENNRNSTTVFFRQIAV